MENVEVALKKEHALQGKCNIVNARIDAITDKNEIESMNLYFEIKIEYQIDDMPTNEIVRTIKHEMGKEEMLSFINDSIIAFRFDLENQ